MMPEPKPAATPDAIRVRDARRTDIDRLVEFNLAMARETENLALDQARLRAGVAALFDDPSRGFYIVAESAGQVAGCMMVTYEWSDWRNANWWWIQSVYVAPAFRRRGVYGEMHRHIVERARQAGAAGLRLYVERNNRTAQQTYLRQGMAASHYDMFEQPLRPNQPA